MSTQSESGRLDYDKSDHAPKGKRMAGDVIRPEDQGFQPYQKSDIERGKNIEKKNLESIKNLQPGELSDSNVVPLRK